MPPRKAAAAAKPAAKAAAKPAAAAARPRASDARRAKAEAAEAEEHAEDELAADEEEGCGGVAAAPLSDSFWAQAEARFAAERSRGKAGKPDTAWEAELGDEERDIVAVGAAKKPTKRKGGGAGAASEAAPTKKAAKK